MTQPHAVAVYTKPGCMPCRATKNRLDRNGTAYTLVDVTEDPGALDDIVGLGYQQVPVVVTDTGTHWSGFQPTMLDALKEIA